ncbi:MAG: restriction endonuclease [Microbacteriaceae bacterium]
MDRVAVDSTSIVVLADGKSSADVSNNRGHLLEQFVAQLLAALGYSKPRTENLNVTSDGVEIDVVANHRISGDRVVCECKAYGSNVAVGHLTSFLGKYALEKADDERTLGLFFALPRLTAEGIEKAKAAEEKIAGFKYFGAGELLALLTEAGLAPETALGPQDRSDLTIVISEFGLAMAAQELDRTTRRGARWVVWSRNGAVAPGVLKLIEQEMASGLPVVSLEDGTTQVPVKIAPASTIIEVRGSTSDFEYQLPAAPEFFVGRKQLLRSIVSDVFSRTSAGALVINAKSGWGKSSLALQIQRQVERAGGVSLVVDTRTAERADFVMTAMEKLVLAGAKKKVLKLPPAPAYSSLRSIIETLAASEWSPRRRPLFLAFDQFENVFRYEELTREFRDLALLVRELNIPLTLSFSWKTDLVGWTEGHPYRLRDEIRDVSIVEILDPLGAREIETLLRRLERELETKLIRELRQRLREYSQGLPWLFKKLAGHVLTEVKRGVTQEELIRQGLNVQTLFETDLQRLSIAEQEVLRSIAQQAPVLVSEIDMNVVPGEILDSLLHQRLIIQVGDRLDIYWDTFRDFLNTGKVLVEDSYVVRYAPRGPGKLLRVIIDANGRINVQEAANQLGTTVTVIFNYSRELRNFGVLTAEPNHLVLEPDIHSSADPEEAIRARVNQALKRHRMYSLAMEQLVQQEAVTLAEFADLLPREFPAVEAKEDSWFTYARSFAQWMEYAGMASLDRDGFSKLPEDASTSNTALLSGPLPTRVRKVFPSSVPTVTLALINHLLNPQLHTRPAERAFSAALRDAEALGLVERTVDGNLVLTDSSLLTNGKFDPTSLRERVSSQRGLEDAIARLRADPSAPPKEIGEIVRLAVGAEWGEETTKSTGKHVRAWARACGVPTSLRRGQGGVARNPRRGEDKPTDAPLEL